MNKINKQKAIELIAEIENNISGIKDYSHFKNKHLFDSKIIHKWSADSLKMLKKLKTSIKKASQI